MVEIDDVARRVIIRSVPSDTWRQTREATRADVILYDFAEINSRIPWIAMANRISGYAVVIIGVNLKSPYDWGCVGWFHQLKCSVEINKDVVTARM
jgi:hypothetical protein